MMALEKAIIDLAHSNQYSQNQSSLKNLEKENEQR